MATVVLPSGPVGARVMVVGEAPGADEEIVGSPFVGASGSELCRMLREAGIAPGEVYWNSTISKHAVRWDRQGEVFVTNVARVRPPGNKIETFFACTKQGKPVHSKNSKLIDHAKHSRLRNMWVTKEISDGVSLLKAEISAVKPQVIIPVGNLALWALTGLWGIGKWRGSMLYSDLVAPEGSLNHFDLRSCILGRAGHPNLFKVLPTYHPAAILRQWSWRAAGISDLRRARRVKDGARYPTPSWGKFIVRPSFGQAYNSLRSLIELLRHASLRLSVDIETRAGHTACIGVTWTDPDSRLKTGICIPLMCVERGEGYWTLDEESEILFLLHQILTDPSAEVVGQNFSYDAQYFWKHNHFIPRLRQDTMISQHSLFSAQPKALHYLASLHSEYYVYWKDEGKTWDASVPEEQLWEYNGLDCFHTDEVGLSLQHVAEHMRDSGWKQAVEIFEFQQSMFWPVLKAMQRGVRIDLARRSELVLEVQNEIDRRMNFLTEVLGHELNPDSPPQMKRLFYEDLGLPVQMKRGKKGEPARPTLEDEALQKLCRIEPLVKPLVNAISDVRTFRKFLSNFLCRSLSEDGRMRCSFNIGGSESGKSAPVTYRLSSSEDAFGCGTNLQTIPSDKSKSIGKAVARGSIPALGDPYEFPNIREIFIPDPGYTWFDLDLERADLFVVCWEADDAQLKAAMRLGVDIHLLNAFVITGKEPPALEELVETHGRYRDHRGPMKMIREFAKVFCHGTNYVGGSSTMAAHTGRTVHEIDRAQRIWFGAHPGIKIWHNRTQAQISKGHFVENRFGYRWYIFDRVEGVLPEAVAWVPQSTVSIVINRIWKRIAAEVPAAEILLQVHDSLPGQFLTKSKETVLPKLREASRIVVPYDDPLIIPVGIKTSEKSWGHC